MRRKNRTRLALGLMLTATIAGTCTVVYQSGSRSVPNEKEFVLNEDDSIDEAMKTEEKENTEENQNSDTQNPETQDVNTSQVEGERQVEEMEETTEESNEDTTEESEETSAEGLDEAQQSVENTENVENTGSTETQAEETASAGTEAVQSVPEVNFTESSLMQWPVEGQVLLDYNMDHTIYFPTLNEYRYSPAIAVEAGVGTPVTAVANGKVVSIVNNEETGITMTVDLGNGYQAVYGQLKDTAFEPESYMEAGATLGYVSEPTKYYSKEGSNLYFAMTKDGVSIDPLEYLP